MAEASSILEYLAYKGVPEKFEWPEVPEGGLQQETTEIVGTLQAGNAEEIFVLTGGVVLRLPTEAVLGIGDSKTGASNASRLIVSTTAVAESRSRLLLLPELRDDIAPLVLKDPETIVEGARYTDKTLERFEDVIEKLKQLKLPVPVGADSGTSTYCYLSSAYDTPGADGGSRSDTDPIRSADD